MITHVGNKLNCPTSSRKEWISKCKDPFHCSHGDLLRKLLRESAAVIEGNLKNGIGRKPTTLTATLTQRFLNSCQWGGVPRTNSNLLSADPWDNIPNECMHLVESLFWVSNVPSMPAREQEYLNCLRPSGLSRRQPFDLHRWWTHGAYNYR